MVSGDNNRKQRRVKRAIYFSGFAQQPITSSLQSSNPKRDAQPRESPGLPSVVPGPPQPAVDGLPPTAPCTNPFRSCYMPPTKEEVVSPPDAVAPSESNTTSVTESTSRDSSEVSICVLDRYAVLTECECTRRSTVPMKISLQNRRLDLLTFNRPRLPKPQPQPPCLLLR